MMKWFTTASLYLVFELLSNLTFTTFINLVVLLDLDYSADSLVCFGICRFSLDLSWLRLLLVFLNCNNNQFTKNLVHVKNTTNYFVMFSKIYFINAWKKHILSNNSRTV